MPASKSPSSRRKKAPAEFLDLFYPFHYRVGFTIEDALRGEHLTQHQTVILWIIRSEGTNGLSMRRKDVEARIGTWFDISSSAISKALRSLAKADEPLLEIREDERSGREKQIFLTRAGTAEVAKMKERAHAVIRRIVKDLSDSEIDEGLNFLLRVSQIVDGFGDRQTG